MGIALAPMRRWRASRPFAGGAAHHAAKEDRNALVEELRQVYPKIERRLADLIGRVATRDATLERVNGTLPCPASTCATRP